MALPFLPQDSTLFRPPYQAPAAVRESYGHCHCCDDADICVCDCIGCDCRYAETDE